MSKFFILIYALAFLCLGVSAQTADEVIAKYTKAVGGIDKLRSVNTIRKTGKYIGGGGFELKISEENKRENKYRQNIFLQGMVGIVAYDGKTGWKIEPWGGKKDVESLSESEIKSIVEGADFDGPLIDYAKKGHKVEYLGKDTVDGDEAYKLKVTLAGGDLRFYFIDSDYSVPVKLESKTIVRGTEYESETIFGDYKEVAGIYYPFSIESGAKGAQFRAQIIYEKIEVNIPLDDAIFAKPSQPAATPKQN